MKENKTLLYLSSFIEERKKQRLRMFIIVKIERQFDRMSNQL